MKNGSARNGWKVMLSALGLAGCLSESGPRHPHAVNEVRGLLVDAHGNPRAGALVKALPARGTGLPKAAAAPGDSALTGPDGRYSLLRLPAGVYNLIGTYAADSLAVLIPEVDHADTTQEFDAGVDTLRVTGRVRGQVTLEGRGMESVIAYLPGTSYLAVTDPRGAFTLSGVPAGEYVLQCLAPGFATPSELPVTVRPGAISELSPILLAYDTSLAPPAPDFLAAEYNAAKGIVRVRWSPARVSDLLGYIIYRDDSATSIPTPLIPGVFADTLFSDTIYNRPSVAKVLTYRVRSIDRGRNTSLNFSPAAAVTVLPSREGRMALQLGLEGGSDSSIDYHDTLRMILHYTSASRKARRIIWVMDSLQTLRVKDDSLRDGFDTLEVSWKGPSNHVVSVTVEDETGDLWLLKQGIRVVVDFPLVDAGEPALVSIRDTVWLHGRARQDVGSIVKWEWDFLGNGKRVATPGGDAFFVAPDTVGRINSCLYVTNNRGEVGYDCMHVEVILDGPVAEAPDSMEVSIGDTVKLSGSARNKFGKITSIEWDVGNTGVFRPAQGWDYSFIAPSAPRDSILCILRVTNEDGLTDTDTTRVRVVMDPPVAVATVSPSEVHAGESFMLSARESWDRYGHVVKREWDKGNTGRFVTSTGTDTVVTAPLMPNPGWSCVLRVTDDDGLTAMDTVSVPIRAANDWIKRDGALPARSSTHAALAVAAGKAWLLGYHIDGGMEKTGLWMSPDMLQWSLVNPFVDSVAGGSPIFAFKDALWMVNAAGEMWSSPDGENWKKLAVLGFLTDRVGYAVVVHGTRIFVMGGLDSYDGHVFQDVWSSGDGTAWTRVADRPSFGARTNMQVCSWNGKLWAYGGQVSDQPGGRRSDLWSSTDGKNWTLISNLPLGVARFYSVLAGDRRMLWLLEGYDSSGKLKREAWHSGDGVNWSNDPTPPGFTASGSPTVINFNGHLWMLPGEVNANAVDEIWEGP